MTTTNKTNENNNAQPTHTLRKKKGYGKKAEFETIGVAWTREDGGFYVKPYGTQIIDGGFYAFPIKEQSEDNAEGGQ